jgi:hypothetical protein
MQGMHGKQRGNQCAQPPVSRCAGEDCKDQQHVGQVEQCIRDVVTARPASVARRIEHQREPRHRDPKPGMNVLESPADTAQIQTAENGRIGTDIKGVVVIEEFKPIDLTVDGQRQRSQTERKDHLAAEEPERAAGHIHYGTRVRHIRGLPEAREATNRSQDSRIRGEKFPSFSSSALDRARIASWQLALRLLENARKSALEHVAPWEARCEVRLASCKSFRTPHSARFFIASA